MHAAPHFNGGHLKPHVSFKTIVDNYLRVFHCLGKWLMIFLFVCSVKSLTADVILILIAAIRKPHSEANLLLRA